MKTFFKNLKGLTFGLGFLVILFIGGIVFASLSNVEEGDILSSQKWNELVGNVNDLNSEMAELKNQNTSLNSAIPQGATIAFNSSACPSGWSIANDLKDKFIIGAGNSYSVGDTGGSATTTGTIGDTTLTTNQIPSHNHSSAVPSSATTIYAFNTSVSVTAGTYDSAYLVTTRAYNISSATTSTTGNAGGGQAHNHTFTGGNNLPPFVAYIYCTKD